MKKQNLNRKPKTGWVRVKVKDETIDSSHIAESEEKYFTRGVLYVPDPKPPNIIHLDHDILKWFKKRKGIMYQVQINMILRSYMDAQKKTSKKPKAKVAGHALSTKRKRSA